MQNRAGSFITNLSGEMAYQSFRPAPLPPVPDIELNGNLVGKLVDANRKIAVLEELSCRIPNMDLFISMYVRKEALLSSQIEGTQCTLDDILDPLRDENANQNVSDVVNYIRATEFAIKRLDSLPLCNRLIKETHAVLMEGVRGQEKSPGEFRYSQNWIGGHGSTRADIRLYFLSLYNGGIDAQNTHFQSNKSLNELHFLKYSSIFSFWAKIKDRQFYNQRSNRSMELKSSFFPSEMILSFFSLYNANDNIIFRRETLSPTEMFNSYQKWFRKICFPQPCHSSSTHFSFIS